MRDVMLKSRLVAPVLLEVVMLTSRMSQGSRSRVYSNSLLFLLALLVHKTSQAEDTIFFSIEPEPYYYSLPGRLTIIPCHAFQVDPNGDHTPIDATPVRDGRPLRLEEGLPERHELRRTTGVIDGVIVRETGLEDAGASYWCQVEREGVISSTRRTHIVVGDGRPLPVGGVEQLDQHLNSVSLTWEEARVPSNSPILSYELSLLPQDGSSGEVEVKVNMNKTSVELLHLTPDTTYLVAVAGVNSYGVGNLSEFTTIMTLTPEVPRKPTQVTVVAVIGTTSTSLVVSWTPPPVDLEVMTPIDSYIIYYGPEAPGENGSMSEVVPVVRGQAVSEYTVTGLTMGGEIRVGVASVNSAGASQVAYYEHSIVVGCGVAIAPDHGTVSQSGLASGSAANYSCREGYLLAGNKTRMCNEQGHWTVQQPSCIAETAAEERTFLLIVFVSLAAVVGLVMIIIVVFILIFVIKRKSSRISRKGRAISTFKNASPPLKRQQPKPSVGNEYSETGPRSEIGLEVLNYTVEPRVTGTPPPPDPTTFQPTPSPPSTSSTNLPPSYSDLEQALTPTTGHSRGYHNHLSSNCSPPSLSVESEMTSTRTPLSVTNSNEPCTPGSTPSPHPPINTPQDSSSNTTSNGTSSA